MTSIVLLLGHEHYRPEVYYFWICTTLICQGISVKVKVTAYSDPQLFAVMTLDKIYSRST